MVAPVETAAVAEAEVRAVVNSQLYPGIIFEYREDGRVAGVMTGIVHFLSQRHEPRRVWVLLQHVMLWPDAPKGALIRMLVEAEQTTWKQEDPEAIVLDVEPTHPYAEKLRQLAVASGFHFHSNADGTTWYIKERS